MPVTKVNPVEVDQKLFETFCIVGYDSASMEMLAGATGLKKASLYHRFPEGKKQMGLHVLANVAAWINENIVVVLNEEKTPVKKRLKEAITAINTLYNGGSFNCILRMMSVGTDAGTFKDIIASCFLNLTESFAMIAKANGVSSAKALRSARDVVVFIQGSLVLSRAMDDNSYFQNCLLEIPVMLSKPKDS